MTASSSKPSKKSKPSLGAPSQLSQASRKGKRAWRKNIDIQSVEEGLESLRTEERVVGKPLQKHTDDQLFVIDTKGDDQVRRSLPRYSKSQLMSSKILAQRSAVPAVVSRVTSSGATKRLSRADKERLLRIAKRPRKGPLNSVTDPTEFGKGSAAIDVSHAVRESGTQDLWEAVVAVVDEENVPEGIEKGRKRPIKKPELEHPRDVIDVPAVSAPHPGASYNPPVHAHEELLMKAHEVERRRQEEADRLREAQKNIEEARVFAENNAAEGVPTGMVIDEIKDDGEMRPDTAVIVPKRAPTKKSKQQRARIAKQQAEKRALTEKSIRKRILNSINEVKGIRSNISKVADSHQQARLARQLSLRLRLRRGLAGQRLGKHRVPGETIDVQIGEDLSENLRNLKPEGNLFRDRFVSLQQRALVEPRVAVLPTKRKAKPKEYEKHAWKRFE